MPLNGHDAAARAATASGRPVFEVGLWKSTCSTRFPDSAGLPAIRGGRNLSACLSVLLLPSPVAPARPPVAACRQLGHFIPLSHPAAPSFCHACIHRSLRAATAGHRPAAYPSTARSRSAACAAYDASTTGVCATTTLASWNLLPAPGDRAPPGVSAARGTIVTRIRHAGCWVACGGRGGAAGTAGHNWLATASPGHMQAASRHPHTACHSPATASHALQSCASAAATRAAPTARLPTRAGRRSRSRTPPVPAPCARSCAGSPGARWPPCCPAARPSPPCSPPAPPTRLRYRTGWAATVRPKRGAAAPARHQARPRVPFSGPGQTTRTRPVAAVTPLLLHKAGLLGPLSHPGKAGRGRRQLLEGLLRAAGWVAGSQATCVLQTAAAAPMGAQWVATCSTQANHNRPSGHTCIAHSEVGLSVLPGIMGGGSAKPSSNLPPCSSSLLPLLRLLLPPPPPLRAARPCTAARTTPASSSARAWWPTSAGWTRGWPHEWAR